MRPYVMQLYTPSQRKQDLKWTASQTATHTYTQLSVVDASRRVSPTGAPKADSHTQRCWKHQPTPTAHCLQLQVLAQLVETSKGVIGTATKMW